MRADYKELRVIDKLSSQRWRSLPEPNMALGEVFADDDPALLTVGMHWPSVDFVSTLQAAFVIKLRDSDAARRRSPLDFALEWYCTDKHATEQSLPPFAVSSPA